MNSGYSTISSTYLNDQLIEFTDYVWSFYGAEDALYPMGLKKVDLLGAIYDYSVSYTHLTLPTIYSV